MRRTWIPFATILATALLISGCGDSGDSEGGASPSDKVTYLTAFGAAGGKKTVVLPYSKYLPELFGNGIIAPVSITRDRPDLARRFRGAALKGLQYTLDHPDEAAQILKKAQPAAYVTAAVGEITLMAPYVKTSGVIDRKRVADAIATLEGGGLIPPGLTPDSVVDFSLAPTG